MFKITFNRCFPFPNVNLPVAYIANDGDDVMNTLDYYFGMAKNELDERKIPYHEITNTDNDTESTVTLHIDGYKLSC